MRSGSAAGRPARRVPGLAGHFAPTHGAVATAQDARSGAGHRAVLPASPRMASGSSPHDTSNQTDGFEPCRTSRSMGEEPYVVGSTRVLMPNVPDTQRGWLPQ